MRVQHVCHAAPRAGDPVGDEGRFAAGIDDGEGAGAPVCDEDAVGLQLAGRKNVQVHEETSSHAPRRARRPWRGRFYLFEPLVVPVEGRSLSSPARASSSVSRRASSKWAACSCLYISSGMYPVIQEGFIG